MRNKIVHTPTPWEIGDVTDGAEEYNECANVRGIQIRGERKAVACIDDANFIVRAVNSHEELLDALKTWEKFWDTMPKGQMGKLSFDVGLFNDGFMKMNQALKKAEGK